MLATAGCTDTDPPVAPGSEPAASLVQTDLRADRGTIDDRWAAISQTEVPGFAGLWFDQATGEIVVAAADPESQSAARDWAERSSAPTDHPGAPIRFDVVSYDFLQLRMWKVAARELLGRPDVVYVDADEVRNRLVLGVTPSAVTSQVRERTRDLDIPDAAVEFVTTSPMEFDGGGDGGESAVAVGGATLQDKVRPTMGGLEVGYPVPGGTQKCTLGFNATLDGEPGDDLYFATNSHCSLVQFGPDNTRWRQNRLGTVVGNESHDIKPHTGEVVFDGQTYDCTNDPCRFSDASLVLYDDTIDAGDVDLGRIARTTGFGEGNLEIAGRRDIVVKRPHPTLHTGLKVRKVGRTTGTTSGSITKICVDRAAPEGFDFDFLCQFEADYVRKKGDSGAPVYILHWDGTVSLIGIHYQETPRFSSLDGIEADLGVTLDVCIPTGCAPPPPPLDVEIDGPTEVLEFSDCTYTADATGAYPPYSYQWYIDEEPVEEEGDQEELQVEVGSASFTLEVRVTDSKGFNDFDEVFVDVSPNHPDCGFSP